MPRARLFTITPRVFSPLPVSRRSSRCLSGAPLSAALVYALHIRAFAFPIHDRRNREILGLKSSRPSPACFDGGLCYLYAPVPAGRVRRRLEEDSRQETALGSPMPRLGSGVLYHPDLGVDSVAYRHASSPPRPSLRRRGARRFIRRRCARADKVPRAILSRSQTTCATNALHSEVTQAGHLMPLLVMLHGFSGWGDNQQSLFGPR